MDILRKAQQYLEQPVEDIAVEGDDDEDEDPLMAHVEAGGRRRRLGVKKEAHVLVKYLRPKDAEKEDPAFVKRVLLAVRSKRQLLHKTADKAKVGAVESHQRPVEQAAAPAQMRAPLKLVPVVLEAAEGTDAAAATGAAASATTAATAATAVSATTAPTTFAATAAATTPATATTSQLMDTNPSILLEPSTVDYDPSALVLTACSVVEAPQPQVNLGRPGSRSSVFLAGGNDNDDENPTLVRRPSRRVHVSRPLSAAAVAAARRRKSQPSPALVVDARRNSQRLVASEAAAPPQRVRRRSSRRGPSPAPLTARPGSSGKLHPSSMAAARRRSSGRAGALIRRSSSRCSHGSDARRTSASTTPTPSEGDAGSPLQVSGRCSATFVSVAPPRATRIPSAVPQAETTAPDTVCRPVPRTLQPTAGRPHVFLTPLEVATAGPVPAVTLEPATPADGTAQPQAAKKRLLDLIQRSRSSRAPLPGSDAVRIARRKSSLAKLGVRPLQLVVTNSSTAHTRKPKLIQLLKKSS